MLMSITELVQVLLMAYDYPLLIGAKNIIFLGKSLTPNENFLVTLINSHKSVVLFQTYMKRNKAKQGYHYLNVEILLMAYNGLPYYGIM
jgi:hypothetical protein